MSPIELKLIPLRCKGGGLKFSGSSARVALILFRLGWLQISSVTVQSDWRLLSELSELGNGLLPYKRVYMWVLIYRTSDDWLRITPDLAPEGDKSPYTEIGPASTIVIGRTNLG